MFEMPINNKQENKTNDKESKDAYIAECKKNNQDLSYDVMHFVNDSYGAENFNKERREDFWKRASDIKKALNEMKLFKADREDLWQKRQSACERVIEYNRRANERFEWKSRDHRDSIINKAGEARPCDIFFLPSTSVDFMKTCSKTIREAWEMLSEYKHEMIRDDKDKCFRYITETQEIVDAWWSDHKKYKEEKHREWERKHDEWETKQHDWQEKTKNNIRENYERRSKAEGARDRVQENIENLEEMIASAKTDSFSDRVSEWLSEAEDKLRDIEESIERIQGWIDEDEAKLR